MNTTYSYDNLSRLLSVTHATGGATLDGATYTVDNAGNRLTRTQLPTGMASRMPQQFLHHSEFRTHAS